MSALPRITTAWLTAGLLLSAATGHAQETVRPEIGKPLQAVQELLKAGKYKDAMARLRETETVPGRTPFENYFLDRMRASAAAGAGDDATAIKSFEAVLASGRPQGTEKLQILEAAAGSAYRAKDYAKAIDWAQRYFKDGGASANMNNLQTSAHYLSGDYAGVVRDMQQKVQAVERAVPVVDENTLRMLAASYAKLGDDAGYVNTLEKLLIHHPKKDYWADMLARVQNKPGFADRLALDVLRLQMATGTLDEPAQYVEMAQLALHRGLPAEAKKVVDAGYPAGKLGNGPEAERHKRLRALADKQTLEDQKALATDVIGRHGDALVNSGEALVTLGRIDQGIELIEQGLAKGGLKRPEDARLHLGVAYIHSSRKDQAIETLKAVRGTDGTAELARLWSIFAARL
jgi:tetratricopeptide (TPR) repeat protein